jgi:NTE family protein
MSAPASPADSARLPGIALALSGGGVRAMAFHIGVLRYLAERGCLHRVTRISTVSGGSLVTGLIYTVNHHRWPSTAEEFAAVADKVRTIMCTTDLRWAAAKLLLWPLHWRFLLSRANLIERAIRRSWGVTGHLHHLPGEPAWYVNGTTAEDGKRFGFQHDGMGDYELGYARGHVRVSTAMAASAAVPGGIGPLAIQTRHHTWVRRSFDPADPQETQVHPPFRALHVYDGAVYDNLGLEPLFDASTSSTRSAAGEVILVSDAGAPLSKGFPAFSMSPFRLKRLADIMADQVRALRVRAFVAHIKQCGAGAYLAMDNKLLPRAEHPDAELTCAFPTDLCKLTPAQFDAMARHGHAVAQAVDAKYPFEPGRA